MRSVEKAESREQNPVLILLLEGTSVPTRFQTERTNQFSILYTGSVDYAECGVQSAECGKWEVWKMWSVENEEFGK